MKVQEVSGERCEELANEEEGRELVNATISELANGIESYPSALRFSPLKVPRTFILQKQKAVAHAQPIGRKR